ncbi:hypothetical protein TNCV_4147441 [Trichonephila clavipes]|nr:hypothetical protein TNCV_4147441 [Trichonephila clavipes]
MDPQLGDHSCGYPLCCITYRRLFNGVIKDESVHMNGKTSFFQMNPSSAYSITIVSPVFGGILVNLHRQRAFVIVILAHHLRDGMGCYWIRVSVTSCSR